MHKLLLIQIVLISLHLILTCAEKIGEEFDNKESIAWEEFKEIHHKNYENAKVELEHMESFIKNLHSVTAHNLAFEDGNVTYSKELNEFADIDPVEFRKRNGFKAPPTSSLEGIEVLNFNSTANRTFPTTFDWRASGKVSPAKNQGQCGCCWAFAAIGALESQILIKNLPPITLSEQQLVSCDINGHNAACNGGVYTSAWDYIIQVSKGLVTDSSYPYTSGSGRVGVCQFNPNNIALQMSSYKLVRGNDNSIMDAVYNNGPIAIPMDARDLQLASSNQIYSCSGRVAVDHAVLVVGYGTTSGGNDYWIVKNSWGSNWGNRGFFNLARGSGDCGATQLPAVPFI